MKVGTQDHVAQTFTPCRDATVNAVILPLHTCDNGRVELTLEIRATNLDGTPADTVLATSQTVDSADLVYNCNDGPYPFQDMVFFFEDSTIVVDGGTTYALVLKASPIWPATSSLGQVA